MKNKNTLRWVLKNSRKILPFMLLLTAMAVVLSFVTLGFTVTSKRVLDIATGQAEGKLLTAALCLAGLLGAQVLIQSATTMINVHANAEFGIEMKRRLFSGIMKKSYISMSEYHSGDLLNRIAGDVQVITDGMISIIPNTVLMVTTLVINALYLFSLDKLFAVLMLITGPCLMLVGRLYSKKYKALHKKCMESDGKTRSFIQEILQNILVVKAFRGEDEALERSERLQRDNYGYQIKRAKLSVVANMGMYLVFNAGYYLALAYGAWKLSLGLFTFGTVTAILQLVNKIQAPFNGISSLIPQYYGVIASAERLIEIEGLPDEQTEDIAPSEIYARMVGIAADRAVFSYNGSDVMEYTLKIKKGEMAVIAGESGAGKSTLIKLLLGILKPESGDIYIECDNGERISLSEKGRGLFSYVPQGNLILSGTIRENIAFASKGATEEDIIRAAKTARIWDFISELPKGLDTVLGEHGLGLSEGQAQRISIARAVLHDAPIMLLDEATSALDSDTEQRVLENIRSLRNKTCIVVSHRKAVFSICDSVINIE